MVVYLYFYFWWWKSSIVIIRYALNKYFKIKCSKLQFENRIGWVLYFYLKAVVVDTSATILKSRSIGGEDKYQDNSCPIWFACSIQNSKLIYFRIKWEYYFLVWHDYIILCNSEFKSDKLKSRYCGSHVKSNMKDQNLLESCMIFDIPEWQYDHVSLWPWTLLVG